MTRIPTTESFERWSEFTLADGTVLMLKATFGMAIRQDGHDNMGNPLYALENPQLVAVVKSAPADLCATKQ